MIKVAIHGAAGRMGQRLIALAHQDSALQVVAAIDHAGHSRQGEDAGQIAGVGAIGVPLTTHLADTVHPDLLIDFSLPEATAALVPQMALRGIPLVIGTTGLGPREHQVIAAAAHQVAVIQATNFSLVVNVLWKLAAEAAALLGDEYDMEVLEIHHRFKQDAPSGTAHTLVEKLCEASGRDKQRDVVYARHGEKAPREAHQITVQTLRLGDHPGEHTAYFATLGERLEIKHVSTSRDSYALGALRAARWLAGKPAGRYEMAQVLGF